MADTRQAMHTPGGLSVRNEIEARLMVAREDARSQAFDEAIAFLRLAGFNEGANALEEAAFGGHFEAAS